MHSNKELILYEKIRRQILKDSFIWPSREARIVLYRHPLYIIMTTLLIIGLFISIYSILYFDPFNRNSTSFVLASLISLLVIAIILLIIGYQIIKDHYYSKYEMK